MLILQTHNFHHSFLSFNVMVIIISLGKTAGKKKIIQPAYTQVTQLYGIQPAPFSYVQELLRSSVTDGTAGKLAGRESESWGSCLLLPAHRDHHLLLVQQKRGKKAARVASGV